MPGKPSQDRPFCRQVKANGEPCKNRAAVGSAWCGSHGGGQAPVGAPTKLDGAMVNRLVELAERGVTWEVAAAACGIDKSTLHGWRKKGATDLELGSPTVFADLVDRLARASAKAEALHVANIAAAGVIDWRASAFYLERRASARWGKRDKVDVDINERAQPRTVSPTEPARRDTILEILATATRAPQSLDDAGQENTP